MLSTIHIRPEAAADQAQIETLVTAAFADAPYSNHNEQRILQALRERGELTLSLVATAANNPDSIVGHITFSPVTLSSGDAGWYGLGPVAVTPEHQLEGIGSALINQGLRELKNLGANGCVLLGEPEYYQRFGFEPDQRLTLAGVPAGYFQTLSFSGVVPNAEVSYSPAFYVD